MTPDDRAKAIQVAQEVLELEHTFASAIPPFLARAVLTLAKEGRTPGTIELCRECRRDPGLGKLACIAEYCPVKPRGGTDVS